MNRSDQVHTWYYSGWQWCYGQMFFSQEDILARRRVWLYCHPISHSRTMFQYSREHVPISSPAPIFSRASVWSQWIRPRIILSYHPQHFQIHSWCRVKPWGHTTQADHVLLPSRRKRGISSTEGWRRTGLEEEVERGETGHDDGYFGNYPWWA